MTNLRRIKDWSRTVASVVDEGYQAMGDEFCALGEGKVMSRLTLGERGKLWFWLPSSWAYEPWMEDFPILGLKDLWTYNPAIWHMREFPGLVNFLVMHVYCPSFIQSLAQLLPADHVDDAGLFALALLRSKNLHTAKKRNSSYTDWKGQLLTCGERVHGAHLVRPFHYAPWAHRFLNFWAGANVWSVKATGRDLSMAL